MEELLTKIGIDPSIILIISLIITILSIVYAMYNKIKFLCLQKASEKVAEVEGDKNLTGEEKFAKVILWINNDLPKLFKNAFFRSIVEGLVQFAYDTSFKYMQKYIERKTGCDVSELMENIKKEIDENAEENKEETENKE